MPKTQEESTQIKINTNQIESNSRNIVSNKNDVKLLQDKLLEIQQSNQDMATYINSKIDAGNGLSFLEVVLLVSLTGVVISKIVPIFKAPKLLYDSITYIKESELKIRISIKDILLQIMGLTNSDRVILAIFHNGDVDSAGVHLRKFTAVAEVNNRLPSIKNILRDIPILTIEDEIEYCQLSNDDWVFINLHPELPKACKDYMDRNGFNAKYSYIFKNKRGMYAILNIHFIEETIDFINSTDVEYIPRQKRIRYLANELVYKLEELKNDTKWWQKVKNFVIQFSKNS